MLWGGAVPDGKSATKRASNGFVEDPGMNRKNERLRIISDNIHNRETVADVGTDHGFLPLYLWQRQKEQGAAGRPIILTDISAESLHKARKNAQAHNASATFDFRLGDGLTPIGSGEVDAVVIAGVGGALIAKMLGACPEKTVSFQKFLLQPRNAVGKLRFWLDRAGFTILAEPLAQEGKTICEIIVAAPPQGGFVPADFEGEGADDIRYEIPGCASGWTPQQGLALPAERQAALYRAFLENKIRVEESILAQIIAGQEAAGDADAGHGAGASAVNQVAGQGATAQKRMVTEARIGALKTIAQREGIKL